MSSAAEIKKKNTADHITGIFNPSKNEFVRCDSNNMKPKYSDQPPKKQPINKKKESPGMPNPYSYPNQTSSKQYDKQKGNIASSSSYAKNPNITSPPNHTSKPDITNPSSYPGKPKPPQKSENKSILPNTNMKSDDHKSKPLSAEDKARQKIAISNHEFVQKHPDLISKNIQTYFDSDHKKIQSILKPIKSKFENIFINDHSTIWSAIDLHKRYYKHIYILNFADSLKPGGGYLNGRGAQEETLCRQTLLYPTICDNPIYKDNLKYGAEGSNNMIYSGDVLVIRYDNYTFIPQKDQFTVNVISAAAVDNRKQVANVEVIMEDRIRKIISLAALKSLEEKDQGKNALILGAFGCGVFKNDPTLIASIFAKILHGEKFRQYFNCIIFPIFKDKHDMITIFNKHLAQIK